MLFKIPILILSKGDDSGFAANILLLVFIVALIGLIFYYFFRMIEMAFVLKYRRPLYNHFYFYLKKLSSEQKVILKSQFSFYNKLGARHQKYFEHRVANFIKDKDFNLVL